MHGNAETTDDPVPPRTQKTPLAKCLGGGVGEPFVHKRFPQKILTPPLNSTQCLKER